MTGQLDRLAEALEASWPPEVTQQFEGWRLRAAKGGGRRVNSARPMPSAKSAQRLLDAIASVDAFYGQRGEAPRLQIIEAADGGGGDVLTEGLCALGYHPTHETMLLEADLRRDYADLTARALEVECRLAALERFWEQAGIASERRRIMERVDPTRRCTVALRVDAQLRGAAFFARGGPWLFVHALHIEEGWRRGGLASQLIGRMSQVAMRLGGERLAAAVEIANVAAQGFFTAQGFRPIARYAYYEKTA